MPNYSYACAKCGAFSAFRSMAEYAEPARCPSCNASSPRSIEGAPMMITRSASGSASGTLRASRVFAGAASGASAGSCRCGCCGGGIKIRRKDWVKKLA